MLRNITIVVAVMTMASSAVVAKAEDACRVYSDLGKTVMSGRQEGRTMADMMDVAAASSNASFGQIMKKMIVAAYEKPRFGSEEMRQSAVVDFQNEVYLQCIKSAG